ncbi:MAG: hypothetical protein J1F01_10110 [Oscillospiraceae bacterium]|nr:hypothetical protein [Oscillospiraceae bacterium]
MKLKAAILIVAAAMCFAMTAFADVVVTTPGADNERYESDIKAINEKGGSDITLTGVDANVPNGQKHTVFIFMIGSDLARYAGYDICEMLHSGFNDSDTNVILIAGGSSNWSINSMNEHPVNVYRLLGGGLKNLNETKEYNIFDTDDIYNIMFKYMSRYRAEKYSVFFWDHGGGFVEGFGKDARNINPVISTARLAKVFSDIRADVKNDFNLDYNYECVGFDACYMADVQTAQAFSDAGFRYFIGSEDIENYNGWNYSFLSALNGGDTESFCHAVIDETSSFYENYIENYKFTLSCIDLSKTERVINALEAIALSVNNSGTFESYLGARGNTRVYGNPGDSRFGGSAHDYVDMKDFSTRLSASGIDASELMAAVNEAVIYNRASDENSGGITVYSYYSSSPGSLMNWNTLTDNKLAQYKTLQQKSQNSIQSYDASPQVTEGRNILHSGSRYTYSMDNNEARDTKAARFCIYSFEDGIYRKLITIDDTGISGNEISVSYDNRCARLENGNASYQCAAQISDGAYEIVLKKDTGHSSYVPDYKEIAITVDGNGSVLDTRYVNSDALASKDDARLTNGDRVSAVINAYDEDNFTVEEIPDIFTMHDTSVEFTELTGNCYGRFEMINAYGYVQYYSPMIELCSSVQKDGEVKTLPVQNITNEITVNGISLKVPCNVDELLSQGYVFSGEPFMMASGEKCYATMYGSKGYIDITIKNFSMDSMSSDKCTVTGISSDNAVSAGISTDICGIPADCDSVYESRGLIRYIYKLNDISQLPDFTNANLGINGMYNNKAHGYVVIEADKATGTVQKIGINSERGCETKAALPKKFGAEYSTPGELGYNPYSYVFDMDNALYRLPVPAKELEKNGWVFEKSNITVPSYGSVVSAASKNGMSIFTELVNYSESAADISDCIVCGLLIDFNSPSPDMILSGGLNLKEACKNIADENYSYVSDRANKFMTFSDMMLYTTGMVLDYSGEMELYGDGIYMYRRYNDIRSMSEFDNIAGYFIY